MAELRVAIVHDWLVGGGAELVVEQLHAMYPEAPIYTSYATPEWRQRLHGQVRTGWLQPFGRIRKFLPLLRIWWFSRLKFDGYDLVLSSSGAEAKGLKVPAGVLHINYCHAPTHYYWSRYEQYLRQPGLGAFDWLGRFGLRLLIAPLRRWDYRAAQRPDITLANSTYTQMEIKRFYDRDAAVVHPPVPLAAAPSDSLVGERAGFIIVGRQTPYKRFDLAVEACAQLQVPLTVVGDGPDQARLRRLAGSSIRFVGQIDDAQKTQLVSQARALIFPGVDDFGITAVEALAAGTPVIAYRGGGALDYVLPGQTGEFFEAPTGAALAEVLQDFDPERYTRDRLKATAAAFSPDIFRQKLQTIIDDSLKARS